MSIEGEIRALSSELSKSRDVKTVQLNPTMGADAVARNLKEVTAHAARHARAKTVVLVSFVK